MLNIKNIISVSCIVLFQNSIAQIKVNTNSGTGTTITNSSAFLDASSSPTWNNVNNFNVAKGLIFPRVDLTLFTAMNQTVNSSGTNNPNRFDGMLVFNTATGTSGIGAVAVEPGFYYYSNKSTTDLNAGTWISVGSGATVPTALSVYTTDTAYTLLDTDYTILCDAAAANIALTLPDPAGSGMNGKVYVIRKVDDSINQITFATPLYYSKGESTTSLNYIKTIRIQSDGTKWYIID